MEIAAVASFVALLVAWIAAPDHPRPTRERRAEPAAPEAQPAAA